MNFQNPVNTEPAMLMAVIQGAVGLFVAFGLDLSAEQVGSIMAVAAAVLGLWTRSKVTPVDKPDNQ